MLYNKENLTMNIKNFVMIVAAVASGFFAFTSGGDVRALYWLALVWSLANIQY